MSMREKLSLLKNSIDYVLERESADYYDIMDIRKQCINVEEAIDEIFKSIEIDLNV